MPTSEDKALQQAAPDEASLKFDGTADATSTVSADSVPTEQPPAAAQISLSPAVRRLVRQFDLDITGIHGTGPAGRIRVGDVMGLLNGRQDTGKRDAPARPVWPHDDANLEAAIEPLGEQPAPPSPAASVVQIPTSTVFDCDVSRVLSHRKKLRLGEVELLTTSYFLTALTTALDATPEITAGHAPRFGVALTTTSGEQRSTFLDTAALSWDRALEERVRAVDAALRANLDGDDSSANLLVHHYGESGSLLATPTPIGAGHAASVGIGRVRREIAVRVVDGVETPRVTARCYVSLSFFPDSVPLHHANRALADAVRVVESWPD